MSLSPEEIKEIHRQIDAGLVTPADLAVFQELIEADEEEKRQKPWTAYRGDPIGYCKNILGIDLTEDQKSIVRAMLEPPHSVCVESAHSIGKTLLEASIVNWFFDNYDPGVVITTAVKFESLVNVLWGEIRTQRNKVKEKWPNYNSAFIGPRAPEIRTSETHWVIGLTAERGEAMTGRHHKYMLFVFDEAEGLPQTYFTAVASMFQPDGNHFWICGLNPVTLSSPVYLETRKTDIQGNPTWKVFNLSALDHPNIAAGLRGEQVPIPGAVTIGQVFKWMKDYPCEPVSADEIEPGDFEFPPESGRWWRPGPEAEARILGRRPTRGSDSVWSESLWAMCETIQLDFPLDEMPELGCDVARVLGGDDCDTHGRWGGCSLVHDSANGRSIPGTVGRLMEMADEICEFANRIRQERLGDSYRPFHASKIPIKIDDCGIGCLMAGTEVLTTAGWVAAEDIRSGNLVYSQGRDGGPVTVEEVYSAVPCPGTSIIESGPYGFSWSHVLPYRTRKEQRWIQTNWSDLLKRKTFLFDTRFVWTGEDRDFDLPEHEIEMPHGGTRRYKSGFSVGGDEFCEFLGWFLSEGCVSGKNNVICIVQKKADGIGKIRLCLDRTGLKYSEKIGSGGQTQFMIWNQKLARWLKDNCYDDGISRGSLRKIIPHYVGEQTPRRIQLFLNAFVAGDGFVSLARGRKPSRAVCTSSKKMIDGLQVLFLKAGSYGVPRIHHKSGSCGEINGRTLVRSADCWRLQEWQGNSVSFTPKESKEYEGTVYNIRITGTTKLFMVRFADKRPFWVHNGSVCDLADKYNFIPVNSSWASDQELRYPNVRSELWFSSMEMARDGGLSLAFLEKEWRDKLKIQATTPKWSLDARKRRVVEPKEDTKKRLGRSPDGMDAFNLAYFRRGTGAATLIGISTSDTSVSMARQMGLFGRKVSKPDDEEETVDDDRSDESGGTSLRDRNAPARGFMFGR